MSMARDTTTFDRRLERDEPSARATRRSLLAGAVALGSLAATAARAVAQETGDAGAGRLTTETHTTTLSDGTTYAWERGTLLVPQNRANPDGSVFELAFHRFPALSGADPATPAIFVLNGGPGFPGLGNEPERASWIEGNMMARIADRVIVGQRGIGTSGPNTACAGPPAPRADEPFDLEAMMSAAVDAARACRAKWEAEGVDLSGITVIEAAHDVRDLARALEYDRIQIQGVSFGSHWGMAVLRYHPEIVARALLAGMEGPDHTYDMPGWILDDLERIAADAEASGAFAGRVPEGGILAGFRRTIARAEQAPIRVPVVRRGGRDTLHVDLTADDIRGLWAGYGPTPGDGHRNQAWAADMIRIAEGDLGGAAEATLRTRARLSGFPTAAFFMFDCGSGISGPRLERLLSDPATDVVGPLGRMYETLCPVWDADLGEGFRAGFVTDVPTVIVHGDWDLSTPLENALELRPSFRNHRFVLVRRGTHGALGEAARADDAFRDALRRFVANGDMSGFPDTVELPPVAWAAPPSGSPAGEPLSRAGR